MAFRLQRLLNLYEREEEHCKLLYQEAKRKQEEAARRVQQLEEELAAAGCRPGYALVGAALHQAWQYRRYLGEQLAAARSALQAAEVEAANAQAELMAARQRHKTLSTLKEKYEAQERFEQARKDQVMLDEAGMRRLQSLERR